MERKELRRLVKERGLELPDDHPMQVNVVRVRDAVETRRREKVPTDIYEICKFYFGWKLEPFHLALLERMFRPGRLVRCWPTDHAKSTMVSFLFPLLSLMNNPDETHIICGANINDSKRRVAALQRELETNAALIHDYPWLAKPGSKDSRQWSTVQFNVEGRSMNKPNPSVLASSTTASDIKGRRGKLILDDVEGQDHRHSAVKRRQLYDFIKLEAIRCYENERDSVRPLQIAVGTPFDVDSIYFRLVQEGWEGEFLRCYTDDAVAREADGGDYAGHFDEDYLWLAQREKVEHQRRQMNRRQFSIAYLMDPTAGDPSILSIQELFKLATEARLEYRTQPRTFVSIDPAGGAGGRRADYAGISVVSVAWEAGEELPLVDVHEVHRVEQGIWEQVHLCSELSRKYGNAPVIYEANSQQGGSYPSVFQNTNPGVKLIRHVTTQGNKFDEKMGLSVVKTLVRNQRLRMPADKADDENFLAFLEELRDLGQTGVHDHIAASVWFVVFNAFQSVRWLGSAGRIKSAYGPGNTSGSTPYFGGRPTVGSYKQWP